MGSLFYVYFNSILLEYLHKDYILQNFYLGNIMFNNIDFIRCNGYPNNKTGIDYSLFKRLAINNIEIDLPSYYHDDFNNKININYHKFKQGKIIEHDIHSWKNNGLFSFQFNKNYFEKEKSYNSDITQLYL